ncbi:hypothetical protein KPH14_011853 [Odynerus spinipes]|uniref:Reverse transcriptase domain-containing protein n=1 Tax=Odynerus spinipes TaxID=1348599 RepID=A0AAD9RFJ7_9HYME|nr:hypothetical protein KPH14_011853 [Odynerus spinipes]
MAENVRTLIRHRDIIRAQLTRLRTALDNLRDSDIPALETRKAKLVEIYNEFAKTQREIEALDDNIEHQNIRFDFDDSHLECLEFIERQIYRLKSTPVSEIASSNATPVNSTVKDAQFLMPKIQIKSFDGNYAEWHSFYDTFNSLVHSNDSIPAVHKLHLLKSYLLGDAANMIGSLNASEGNYLVAWNLLQKRFDQPRKIIQAHIRALFELPDVAKDANTSLRLLAERVEMHVNSLKALGQPVDWHEMLIYIISSKLDKSLRNAWERSLDDGVMPTLTEFLSFLAKNARDADPIRLSSSVGAPKPRHTQSDRIATNKSNSLAHVTCVANTSQPTCALCKREHFIQTCPTFLGKQSRDRADTARRLKLCLNCLRSGHSIAQCRSSSCRNCQRRHNTLLHFYDPPTVGSKANNEHPQPSTSIVALTACSTSETLLSTARVKILDKYNRVHECRALLDNGAQINLITERLAEKLQLAKTKLYSPATGVGLQRQPRKYSVEATIKSRTSNYQITSTFSAIPAITGLMPSRRVDRESLALPNNLSFADPDFDKPANIDLLLGERIFYQALSDGHIDLSNQTAILHNTRFGWIVSGEVDTHGETLRNAACYLTTTLDQQLHKFWEIEEIAQKAHLSPEEQFCETHFSQNTSRSSDGRYTVKLPFNQKQGLLGSSYNNALRRFYALERKFERNQDIQKQYNEFLSEYERLGHMTDITDKAHEHEGYYLPHHAVIKGSSLTTKIRVVFDGSAKTASGISLNDTLAVGPTIQDDVFALTLRFRSHAYVHTADIEKMYRQINVHEADRKYQKILWRTDKQAAIKTFQLNTVTYGTSSAPFLAVRALHQLANESTHLFPLASTVLTRDFYIDDLLTGANSLEQAVLLRDELTTLLKSDSTITLHWIRASPHTLKTFIANRVSEIQSHTCPDDWLHVPTGDNPADFISRGQPPSELIKNTLWEDGPAWLSKSETDWPKLQLAPIDIPEQRTPIVLIANTSILDLFERFSKFTTLLRAVAYCLRFKANSLNKQRLHGELSAAEIHFAYTRVISLVQATLFPAEYQALKTGL